MTPTKDNRRKVILTFDKDERELLQENANAHKKPLAKWFKEAGRLQRATEDYAKRGFTQVVLRNPETGEEVVVIFP